MIPALTKSRVALSTHRLQSAVRSTRKSTVNPVTSPLALGMPTRSVTSSGPGRIYWPALLVANASDERRRWVGLGG